eukprot:2859208-Pleurochrysis_carterae.AAC.1
MSQVWIATLPALAMITVSCTAATLRRVRRREATLARSSGDLVQRASTIRSRSVWLMLRSISI